MKHWRTWIVAHEIGPALICILCASLALKTCLPGLLGLLGLWILRRLETGHFVASTPVDIPILFLLSMGVVGYTIAVDQHAALLALARLTGGIGLLYSLVHWLKRAEPYLWLEMGLCGIGVALALATPFAVSETWRIPGVPLLLSDPLNANMVAGVLVMCLPIPLAGLLYWRPQRHRGLLYGGLSLCLLLESLALALTQSRGAWMGAAAALGVLLVGRWRFLLGLAIPAGGSLAWLVWQGRLTPWLDTLGAGGVVSGWSARVEIWSRALYMIQDFPFTGVGLNTFYNLVQLLYPFFLIPPDTVIPHAHNLLLQVTVDMGLPGLIAFLALLGGVVLGTIRSLAAYDRPETTLQHALVWGGGASLTAMLVHGLVDAATWIIGWAAPLPWAVMGMLLALYLWRPTVANS